MAALSDRLQHGLDARLESFGERIESVAAGVGSSGPGLRQALGLFRDYVAALCQQRDDFLATMRDEDLRAAGLRQLLIHLHARLVLFDTSFARGHLGVPRALIAAVERECDALGLPGRRAVLTTGPPGDVAAFLTDLPAVLFHQLSPRVRPAAPPSRLVLLALPDTEGARAAWQPVVLGHGVAHYALISRPLPGPALPVGADVTQPTGTGHLRPGAADGDHDRQRALQQIAARWWLEITCDAYTAHRFGPAGAAALTEFLDVIGTTQPSAAQPPPWLRARLLLDWLASSNPILEPVAALAVRPSQPDWADHLCDLVLETAGTLPAAVERWAGFPAYTSRRRDDVVTWVAAQLTRGLPGGELTPDGVRVEAADVVNACWRATDTGSSLPIDRLARKALDTLDVLARWEAAGGSPPARSSLQHHAGAGEGAPPPVAGALSERELRRRLRSTGPDGIAVTPQLPASVKGASMDVRLGNVFIVFQRSAAAAFDSLDPEQDPRSMQIKVEKAWGEVFHLHPGQLVLAATLEYIVLPDDLTAQVVTRSSYGRLGLISATAVQVHPGYAGCLTLELVNLGEMPLTITPGERIAQLMFFTTEALPSGRDEKYRYPTEPEFSKIRADEESRVLQAMRDAHARHGTLP